MLYLLGPPQSSLIGALRTLWHDERFIPLVFKTFEDGEVVPQLPYSLQGMHVALVYPWDLSPLSSWLIHVLWTLDALNRQNLGSLCVCLPYMPLGRTHDLSGLRTWLRLSQSFRIQQWIWLDGHHPDMTRLFSGQAHTLSIAPLWADDLKCREKSWHHPLVIAPDKGAVLRASEVADLMGWPWIRLDKTRTSEKGDVAYLPLKDAVIERDCIVIDDIMDSGKTLRGAVSLLHTHNAASIYAYVTHSVRSQQTYSCSGLTELTLSDTIDLSLETMTSPRLYPVRHISVAPILIKTLQEYSETVRSVV